LKVVYSFNKSGVEADAWQRELASASTTEHTVIPFNHGEFVGPLDCVDSVQLDRAYQADSPKLALLHEAIRQKIAESNADGLLVTNSSPYHPDFLRSLNVYKALYSTDDPGATYQRTIPYVHAFDHVFHCAPGYSKDLSLSEKLRYSRAVNVDFLPLGVFDFEFEPQQDEDALFAQVRDIDVIYVGGFFKQKIPLLAEVNRLLGKRLRVYGFFKLKHNLYLNVRFGFARWISPVTFAERTALYRRAKVGFNIHWNEFGLGNQRLFHLPANGVAQVCDCPDLVSNFFAPGDEISVYRNASELVATVEQLLSQSQQREDMARKAYRRTMREYRIAKLTLRAVERMAECAPTRCR
jgi:glycosyltransferase involved in cell wall biosynthesis